MAVVQISKIQVRRGKKNSNSGIPQLSSAEFAWAVDTQELYIGNGAVSEGAPYVGNTKIITEHDNILDLASAYRFANDDISIVDSVSRDLQNKLDEYVSVNDFGAIGDGLTDDTPAFQKAFDTLFRNTNPEYRKTLIVPNGEYVLSNSLRIPSMAKIKGETVDGTKLNISDQTIRLESFSGSEFVDFSSTNRPEKIEISNITFLRTSGTIDLSGIVQSKFENVVFRGTYDLGDPVPSLSVVNPAIFWQNPSFGVAVNDIVFTNCYFENNSLSIKCVQTAAFETNLKFSDCYFLANFVGIYVDGVLGQKNTWYFSRCDFEQIYNEAFRATYGQNTSFESCGFINVGNGISTAQYPESPMIYFGEKTNNKVIDCRSNRFQSASIVDNATTSSVIEVQNVDKAIFIDRVKSSIYLSDSFRPLAVFSVKAKYIIIDYFLTLGTTTNYSRIGQITLSIGSDLTGDNASDISITDNYQYSPNLITSPGGIIMNNLEFNAEIRSNSTLDDSTLGANVDTILLSYRNPILSGSTGDISFQISYGV